MQAETDLEPKLLGRMFSDAGHRFDSARGLLRSSFDVMAHTVRSQLLRYMPRLYLLAKNEQRRRQRAFKGLHPRF
jgi:hypothetical protein